MNINKITKLAGFFVKALEKPIDEWLKCDDCGKPENQYHEEPFFCWECIQRRKEKGLPLTPKENISQISSNYNDFFINQIHRLGAKGEFYSALYWDDVSIFMTATSPNINDYDENILNNCSVINLIIAGEYDTITFIADEIDFYKDIGLAWNDYFIKETNGNVKQFYNFKPYQKSIAMNFPPSSKKLIIDFLTDLKKIVK